MRSPAQVWKAELYVRVLNMDYYIPNVRWSSSLDHHNSYTTETMTLFLAIYNPENSFSEPDKQNAFLKYEF